MFSIEYDSSIYLINNTYNNSNYTRIIILLNLKVADQELYVAVPVYKKIKINNNKNPNHKLQI